MPGKKIRRNQKGLSLLEILMAVILLAMCIMATATVFPGGYKLNMSNRYANQATEYARGIMEEINARPFVSLGVPGIDNLSLQSLAGWNYALSETNMWPFHFYTSVNDWKTNCPVRCWATGGDKFFFLPEQASSNPPYPKGIEIVPYPGWGEPPQTQARMAKIQVTVAWKEFRGSLEVTKFVSIVSWRTDNKLDF
jgi:prepilin-type N-terminal cleavage/methylation domain-containing protein